MEGQGSVSDRPVGARIASVLTGQEEGLVYGVRYILALQGFIRFGTTYPSMEVRLRPQLTQTTILPPITTRSRRTLP